MPLVDNRTPLTVLELEHTSSDRSRSTDAMLTARALFSTLELAGKLPSDAAWDGPLPSGVELPFRVRGRPPQTYGELLTRLVRDVDQDGRLDVSLSDLVGTSLLPAGTTENQLQDIFSKELSGPMVGALGGFDVVGGLVVPALRLQKTLALEEQPTLDVRVSGGDREFLEVPMLRFPDGHIETFHGEVQEGAQVLPGPSLTVVDTGKVVLQFPDHNGKLRGVELDALGRTRTRGADPNQVRDALETVFSRIDELGPSAKPMLRDFRKLVADTEKFRNGAPSDDPIENRVRQSANTPWKTVLKHSNDIEHTNGRRPRRYTKWANDLREVPVLQAIERVADQYPNLSANLLYTVAMGEGLGVKYMDPQYPFAQIDVSQSLGGFEVLGTDTFAAALDRLQFPKGYAEGKDYSLQGRTLTSEDGSKCTAVKFQNLEAGLVALAAMIEDARSTFMTDIRKQFPEREATLSQEEIDYYTYLYFNVGGGAVRKLQRDGVLRIDQVAAEYKQRRQTFLNDTKEIFDNPDPTMLREKTPFWSFVYFHYADVQGPQEGLETAKTLLKKHGLGWDGAKYLRENANGRLNSLERVGTLELLRRLELFPKD